MRKRPALEERVVAFGSSAAPRGSHTVCSSSDELRLPERLRMVTADRMAYHLLMMAAPRKRPSNTPFHVTPGLAPCARSRAAVNGNVRPPTFPDRTAQRKRR